MDDFLKFAGIGLVGYLIYQAMQGDGQTGGASIAPMNFPANQPAPAVSTTNPFGGSNPGGFSASTTPANSSTSFSGSLNLNLNPGGVTRVSTPTPFSNDYASQIAASQNAAALKTSGVMQSSYTGRSAPDAPADAAIDPASLHYLSNCTYITGAPIQPPPAGC